MTYAVVGEQEYLQTITAGYDILQQNHLYATGGFGPGETFGAAGGSLSRSLWDNTNWCGYRASFETPCGCLGGLQAVRIPHPVYRRGDLW